MASRAPSGAAVIADSTAWGLLHSRSHLKKVLRQTMRSRAAGSARSASSLIRDSSGITSPGAASTSSRSSVSTTLTGVPGKSVRTRRAAVSGAKALISLRRTGNSSAKDRPTR